MRKDRGYYVNAYSSLCVHVYFNLSYNCNDQTEILYAIVFKDPYFHSPESKTMLCCSCQQLGDRGQHLKMLAPPQWQLLQVLPAQRIIYTFQMYACTYTKNSFGYVCAYSTQIQDTVDLYGFVY